MDRRSAECIAALTGAQRMIAIWPALLSICSSVIAARKSQAGRAQKMPADSHLLKALSLTSAA
jgi:hypothetical protein